MYPYESATPEQKKIGAWWWCVHHEIHVERLIDPIEDRVEYINLRKPERERERRLSELRPVLHQERLPERITKAWAEYEKALAEREKALAEREKAWAVCDKARAVCDKALAERDKAWAEYEKALAEREKAWAVCDKARAVCDKALAVCEKAWAEYEPELMALHREEYPNTKWNGKTIFGGE